MHLFYVEVNNMTDIIQKGKIPLRPRARLIKTIGEELISHDNVAIMELVKNSYDAYAKKVEIEFIEPLVKGDGAILIRDDGIGMDLDTVKKGWMEPATPIKLIKKKRRGTRKLLGEKGIGRFASAKLSKKMDMITKTKNGNEIHVSFNWDEFDNEKKYLDEVDCEWEVRSPNLIKTHGTILMLKNLASEWDEEKLRQLKVSLSRLVNPFDLIKDFEIRLILPKKFEKFGGVVSSPESLSKPDYTIEGRIDENGDLKFNYYCKKNKKSEKDIKIKINLKPTRKYTCGPIDFEFRAWDREKEHLDHLANEIGSTLVDIKKDLDETAGISVYRDNFRVLPYGEPKNDWLRLDLRRVNNPTLRLSNNQIIGYVAISLKGNPLLIDQSNREGIVESIALNDLKESIISILNELENRRYDVRPRKEHEKDSSEGLFSRISIESIKEIIEKKLPNDSETKKTLEKTDLSIKEGVRQIQEVLSRYRRLSTLGMLLDVVLHDGNNLLLRLDNEAHLLEKEFEKESVNEEKISQHIGRIKLERQTLSQLFKRLEPFGGRKRGRPKDIILEDSISNVFELYRTKLEELDIQIKLPASKTIVKFDESELEIIFVNLLDNSIYWLDSIDQKDRKIEVQIYKKETELSIIFSDNGPGVKDSDSDKIFDPYFSRKPDGTGLGLTIVGELITEYDGIFELIANGPLSGANFRIIFRKRV